MTDVAKTIREGANARPARRRQVDRSAATRASLADAAVDLLIERGWAAVTAADVCKRAGVTTGAFHHHYTSLPSLLADALRRLYTDMGRNEQPPITNLVGLLDANWAAIGNPRFKAVLEAWLAMANDPNLRAEVEPVVTAFSTLVSPASIAPNILTDANHRDFYAMAREAMIGLALGRATNGGKPLGHEERVLNQLRTQAASICR
jgi:AcrR family transcriptional regulator